MAQSKFDMRVLLESAPKRLEKFPGAHDQLAELIRTVTRELEGNDRQVERAKGSFRIVKHYVDIASEKTRPTVIPHMLAAKRLFDSGYTVEESLKKARLHVET